MSGAAAEDVWARQLRELAALNESLRALTSTLSLPEILHTVLERIKALVSAEGLSLLLWDAAREELVFAASEMLRENVQVAAGVPAPPPAVASCEPRRLVVPLRSGDRLVGGLELRDRLDDRPFDAADLDRAVGLAAELGPRLAAERLCTDAQALAAVFARLGALIPTYAATLTLFDPAGRPLAFTAARALEPGVIDGVRLRAGQGIAGWVALHREAVCLDDASTDPRHDPTIAQRVGLVPHTMLSVPLLHGERLLGVLQVINRLGGGGFTAEEQRLVRALADAAAVALANAALYRQVEEAALTDDLTGLGNTRRFNRDLPALIARGGPVSLLVLDLDGLKQVVDTLGHLVGSRAIATVGRLVRERLRPGDVAARFGGDELVAILPATDTEVARGVAESIRAAVAAMRTPDGMDADVTSLTASLGVATYPTHAADAESLFRAADTALYAVKRRTKNAVAVAGPPAASGSR